MDDYTRLLFALEVRKLALDMLHAERPESSTQGAVPDDFRIFMERALREAESSARFISRMRTS